VARRGQRLRIASAGEDLAIVARRRFQHRKTVLLRELAAERRTVAGVLASLERFYRAQTDGFLRTTGTTYAAWLAHGPRAEIEELREAARDPAVWDRLVETYARRQEAGSRW
jgi:hypothetical protein